MVYGPREISTCFRSACDDDVIGAGDPIGDDLDFSTCCASRRLTALGDIWRKGFFFNLFYEKFSSAKWHEESNATSAEIRESEHWFWVLKNFKKKSFLTQCDNGTACIRLQCRITVLSCHMCLKRGNHLPVSVARWLHWSQICFATFTLWKIAKFELSNHWSYRKNKHIFLESLEFFWCMFDCLTNFDYY